MPCPTRRDASRVPDCVMSEWFRLNCVRVRVDFGLYGDSMQYLINLLRLSSGEEDSESVTQPCRSLYRCRCRLDVRMCGLCISAPEIDMTRRHAQPGSQLLAEVMSCSLRNLYHSLSGHFQSDLGTGTFSSREGRVTSGVRTSRASHAIPSLKDVQACCADISTCRKTSRANS
ncbi:hypothetical protein RRG08_000740 [Elysia crispata]|uniref:Uncharacterized protein n=1 Tax=Elysia crispata TaxID=231223 RepID=A0AAE1DWS5_9GAST|nr:hypothetical protein RRG08_000740 [Elysia crispata]